MTPFLMFDAWAAKGRSWRRMSREREMNHDSPENIGSFPVLQLGRSVDARWTAGWTLSKSCTNLIGSANGVEETFDDLGNTCIARREMRLVAWRGTMSRERCSSAVGRLGVPLEPTPGKTKECRQGIPTPNRTTNSFTVVSKQVSWTTPQITRSSLANACHNRRM
jgi:hypothetical protein